MRADPRLPTLVIARARGRARRYEFDEKKTRYFMAKGGVSDFPLTTQVLKETDWTPAVVERRQKDLLATLLQTWGA